MSTFTLDPAAARPVASFRHTALLVGIFVALAVGGAIAGRSLPSSPGEARRAGSLAPFYLSLMVMEWGLVLYVARGLRRRGVSLRTLVGGRWARPRDVAIDVLVGLLAWGVWVGVARALDGWPAPGDAGSVAAMLPSSRLELGLWIALAVSAGFAEELVFRGYLQAQLHALTHRRTVALVLQATLFGISHGYKGAQGCIRIVIYGLLMGILALARGSLRPGMVAHAWTDIAGGILRI